MKTILLALVLGLSQLANAQNAGLRYLDKLSQTLINNGVDVSPIGIRNEYNWVDVVRTTNTQDSQAIEEGTRAIKFYRGSSIVLSSHALGDGRGIYGYALKVRVGLEDGSSSYENKVSKMFTHVAWKLEKMAASKGQKQLVTLNVNAAKRVSKDNLNSGRVQEILIDPKMDASTVHYFIQELAVGLEHLQ